MLCALCIAINIVLGIVMAAIKFPVYLDTIGTLFTAIFFGPWYGAVVGALTNFLTAILSGSMGDMPFMLVNIAIGLVAGFIFRKVKLTLVSAIVTGIIVGFLAPVIGTPIGIAVYGGLTGTVSDIAVAVLKQSGLGIFASSFLPKLFNNLIDKIGSLLLVYLLVRALPVNEQLIKVHIRLMDMHLLPYAGGDYTSHVSSSLTSIFSMDPMYMV